MRPTWSIKANNNDVTDHISPLIQEITVEDCAGLESDRLTIVLVARNNQPIEIPPEGTELEVALGHDNVNQPMGLFVYDEPEISETGVTITARAAVWAQSSQGKSQLQSQKNRTWPKDTTLGDMVQTIAQSHKLQATVSADLAAIKLPHTTQIDESDINLLVRITRQFDAVVKPQAGRLIVTRRAQAATTNGKPLTPVPIKRNQCQSDWRYKRSKRETAGQVVAYHQAVNDARREEIKVGEGEPVKRIKQHYPTKELALAAARAELTRSARGEETFSLTLAAGDPRIGAEVPITLEDFHKEANGEGWIVARVTHRWGPSGASSAMELERGKAAATDKVEINEDS